ncbi:MAG: hypothetical protein ACFE7R_00735 [Candidatus Hodarchaeota archaeon]
MKNFAYISGENPVLGKAEVKVLVEMIDSDGIVTWQDRLAIIDTENEVVPFLLNRAAMVQETGHIIGEAESCFETPSWISTDQITSILSRTDTFAIRSKSLLDDIDLETRKDFVLQLGTELKEITGARVSLKRPDVKILVFFTSKGVLVCKSWESDLRGLLQQREPGKKRFFHPSMMNSKLARVMCNLARVRPKEIVLDPFCGGGGILCEIISIGAWAVGSELRWSLLKGARENLAEMGELEPNLIQSDARRLPFGYSKFNHIVTDPPYGRSSSTQGETSIKLVQELFEIGPSLVSPGGRMSVCASSEMDLKELATVQGLRVGECLRVRVHSGLTREIVVIEV